MSSIWGYYTTQPIDREKTNNYLTYWNLAYGRDSQKAYLIDQVSLGCCYNSLVSTPPPENPIISRGSKHYVLDAIIYNRSELLDSLLPLNRNISDEELFVSYIEKYTLIGLSKINGDFAGAVFDSETSILTLFRDHMGVRPLFYYKDASSIVFSTDIRGLISLPFVDSTLNSKWLYQLMNGYGTTSLIDTEIEKVKCVLPASYISFHLSDLSKEACQTTYWQLGKQKVRMNSEKEYQEKLRSLISDSIKRRLDRFPGKVGAELSGGLDSSVISILINHFHREGVYHSWSLDPKQLPYVENDERYIIDEICSQENIQCHYNSSLANQELAKSPMQYMEETMGIDTHSLSSTVLSLVLPIYANTLPICSSADYVSSQGSKVIFSGHGGDEGVSHRSSAYEMYANGEYYHFLRYMYSTTHNQKHRICSTLSAVYKTVIRDRKSYNGAFHFVYSAPDMLSESISNQYREEDMPQSFFRSSPKDYILAGGSRNRFDVTALLGAYSGVQYVFPYMDYNVIDYAVSIPRYLYLKGHRNRYIFREAFKDILPPSLYILRRKSEASMTSNDEESDWFIDFDKQRKNTVSLLNREFWKGYLDFEIIDKWLVQGRPDDQERTHFEGIDYCLFQCARFENEITRTKQVTEQHFR